MGFTYNYAPPEVFNENISITFKSDIYTFGITIWGEIITQRIPFNKQRLFQTKEMNDMIKQSAMKGIHPHFYEVIILQFEAKN